MLFLQRVQKTQGLDSATGKPSSNGPNQVCIMCERFLYDAFGMLQTDSERQISCQLAIRVAMKHPDEVPATYHQKTTPLYNYTTKVSAIRASKKLEFATMTGNASQPSTVILRQGASCDFAQLAPETMRLIEQHHAMRSLNNKRQNRSHLNICTESTNRTSATAAMRPTFPTFEFRRLDNIKLQRNPTTTRCERFQTPVEIKVDTATMAMPARPIA